MHLHQINLKTVRFFSNNSNSLCVKEKKPTQTIFMT
jgi:hypothetical protein